LARKDKEIQNIIAKANGSISQANADKNQAKMELRQAQRDLEMNQRELNIHVDKVEGKLRVERQKWTEEKNDLLNQILDLSGGGEYVSEQKLKLMLQAWRGAVGNCVPSIFKAPNIKDPEDAAILDRFADNHVLKLGDPQLFNYVAESWLFRAVLERTSVYFCIGLDEALNEVSRELQPSPNPSERGAEGCVAGVIGTDKAFRNFEELTSQALARNG
jgi:hypothetical protein